MRVMDFYHHDEGKIRENWVPIDIAHILKQIDIASQQKRQFLYLGYQIEECSKMNYKNRYTPHQILVENQWQTVNK